jgi:hypothetical protein
LIYLGGLLCLAQVASGLVKNESEVYDLYVRDVEGFVGFTMIAVGTSMEEPYCRLYKVPIMKTLNIITGAMDCTLFFSLSRKYIHVKILYVIEVFMCFLFLFFFVFKLGLVL